MTSRSLLLLLLAAVTAQAHAAGPNPPGTVYIGGSLGFLKADGDSANCAQVAQPLDGYTSCNNHPYDVGVNVYVGYHYNPWLSLEGAFVNLGNSSTTVDGYNIYTSPVSGDVSHIPDSRDRRVHARAFTFSAIGSHRLGQWLSINGRLGAYLARTTVTNEDSTNAPPLVLGSSSAAHNVGLLYGAGLENELITDLHVRLDWTNFNKVGNNSINVKHDISMISIGLNYTFQ